MTNDRPSVESSTVHSTRDARLGGWAAILMSLAALSTSWASYQASLWSGEQAVHSASSAELRAEATRAYARAGELRMIDIGTFAHWMTAKANHDTALADFISSRFRHEFKPVFESWVDSKPLLSPKAAPTPFAHSSYRLAEDAIADSLDRTADRESTASRHANRMSNTYVLDAVIMATVLFFAGTERGGVQRIRFFMLLIATSMFAMGFIRLLTEPRL